MNALSRRKFLKISGTTVASAALVSGLSSCFTKNEKEWSENPADDEIKQIATYCSICFWKCGVIGHVRNGKLWKLTGNPLDPLSKGRLCPRGTGGIGTHFDSDRLKTPLIRVSERGEEKWKEVTWDEALSFIANKMKKIKAEYGAKSLASFSHGPGGTFFKHTFNAFGMKNIVAPSFAQCRGPRETGFELTFGEVIGSPERTDIENTKCMALIGSHLGENMHNSQVQEFSEAVKNDASIIVVDPRFSIAASKAKYYLPIKPGTDIALLLAWMNVMVEEGIYDKEFVNNYGFGFEQFAAYVKQFTPEWAYPETGIEAELIRLSARELAKNKPASFVHPGRHTTWYGDDAQRSRAIALVNALLGNWNHKGAFFLPAKMSVPKYPYPEYPDMDYDKVDNPNKKYPFVDESEGLTNGIREATISGNPYPIKAWFVYATNLIQAMPNTSETLEAINNLDLLVVIDVIPNEIAGYADVVLPETVYLERWDDLNLAPFKIPFMGIRQPVVQAPNDQKDNWWIAKKLAGKLGLGHYYPWNHIEDYLKYRVEQAGLNYKELKAKGIIRGSEVPIYIENGVEPAFFTETGKVEFYSTKLETLGFDPIPKYTKHETAPPGYFRLLFGRAPVHTFSMTQTNSLLMDMMDENEIWINIDVANKYGFKSGDYIKLKNTDGVMSNKIKVKATERIRTDCVYMVHGFGHTAKALKRAFMKGASDSTLVTQYRVDPLMGGTGMNMNFVTFEPVTNDGMGV